MAKKNARQAELREMRAKLVASKKGGSGSGGSKRERKGVRSRTAAPTRADAGKVGEVSAGEATPEDITAHLHDIVGGLGREFKNANPIVLLATFGLGILIGRLLPR